jgi:hypothetical protein
MSWTTASGFEGPESNIRGDQARTNPPPGGGLGSDLPSSIAAGIAAGLRGLEGIISNLNTQQQQTNLFLSQMTGKATQGGTMFGGVWGPMGVGGTTHTTGKGTVPTVTARFDMPGGGFTEVTDPSSQRGQPGALPTRAMTMGSLRTRAARAISTTGSGIFGPRLESYYNENTKKMETHQLIRDADGNVRSEKVDEGQVPKLQRAERVGSAFQGAVGRAVAGEGLGGVGQIATALLPEGAMLGLGAAGAVGAVGYEGVKMIQNQRAQNAQYQAILGGSNFSQFGQRISSAAFGIRNMFSFGSGQAQEAFMGATQLGMRGQERNSALNMMVSSFNSMGMSVAQSLAAITVQAQSGYENFNDLEKSLKGVSAAAKDTAQNAEAVRQGFIQTYQGVTQNVGGGAGTLGVSTAISKFQANLGRQFQGMNFSGVTGNTQLYEIASEQGMNFNQVVQKMATNPTWGVQAVNKNIDTFLSQAGGGQAIASLRQQMKSGKFQVGANGQVDPAQLTGLATNLLTQLPNVQGISSILSAAGIDTSQMNPMQVAQAFIGYYAQNGLQAPAAAGPQTVGAAQRQALAATSANPAAAAGSPGGAGSSTAALGAAAKGTGLKGGVQIDVGTITGSSGAEKLRRQYLAQIGKTGQNSTIIDQMLKSSAAQKMLYRVNTSDGSKVVNFQDLITNYSDQAASGGVEIAQGTMNGQNVAGLSASSQFGGTQGDPAAYAAANAAASSNQKLKGKDLSGKLKTGEAATGKAATQLQISATPQLQQLLSFAVNGQSVSASSATSLVAPLGPVNPDSMAGSSPANYSGYTGQ